MGTVLGIDGCRTGWVGVLWGATTEVVVAPDIVTLVASTPDDVEAIAIDIPIALPTDTRREAERLARGRLPGRASTVFTPPSSAALRATSYEEANTANRRAMGLGVSRQAYALLPKIADVHDWLARWSGPPVVEAHPEVCFAAMHGSVVVEPKSRPDGAARRRALLAAAGIQVDEHRRPGVGTDDVLDAAAVAWTARRVADGVAERLPAEPRDRPSPAIWV